MEKDKDKEILELKRKILYLSEVMQTVIVRFIFRLNTYTQIFKRNMKKSK